MESPVLQVRVPDGTRERIDAARGEQSRSDWARAVILAALDGELMTPEQAVAYVYEMRTGGPVTFSMAPQLIEEAVASAVRAGPPRTAPEAAAGSSSPGDDGFPVPRMPRRRGGG